MEIIALKIPPEIPPLARDILWQKLSTTEKEAVTRLVRPRDSLRQLVATSFLRTVLCSKLQLSNNDLHIQRGAQGKPFIAESYMLHFNLSHAGEYVVCALDPLEIGIDIEEMRARDLDAMSTFFSPAEIMAYSKKSSQEKTEFFYRLWTAKESFIKAVGKGFAIDVSKFTICLNDPVSIITDIDTRPWQFRHYEIAPRYMLAVCALTCHFPKEAHYMDFQTLVV
jgi:4'-phosphopantetheinyl transferase